MPDQSHYWSEAANIYDKEFIDPYRADVRNPLPKALRRVARRGARVVADLGCGLGPLLPLLSNHFERVIAVDFAAGMLDEARKRNVRANNVEYLERNLLDLTPLHGQLDAAVSVNSLVMPSVADQEQALRQIHACLKPGGLFLGILPAMDSVHYQTMLLVDRALDRDIPERQARMNAVKLNDHDLYDFAFGQFRFQGLEQHFWQPFEIAYRFARCGLRLRRRKKVHLSWEQFGGKESLKKYPPPWDWFFLATKQSR